MQKLVACALAGDDVVAAVQRSVFVLRLPRVLAVHRRLLYGSENSLWELIASELGAEWRRTQMSALGLCDDTPRETFESALRLYELAVAETRELLDERQAAVVDRGLDQARRLHRSDGAAAE